ncbi:hypothetical protein [Methanoregula sp.]|uniref:hypothetical protein n=1 Tax=Methanoregula sp. TaxID=2052170 RepID=UPI0025ED0E89|nr:hypothetical protein [Methanoregula sp.]
MVSVAYADSSTGSTTSSTTSSSSTSSTSSSSTTDVDNAAMVYVSNVTMDPEVFFPGDTGAITVTLTNGGTSAIGISHPDILSSKLNVDSDGTWDTMSYVGAGSTITYTLIVTAKPPDGTYYAMFSAGTKTGNSIHYPIKIEVDSTDIQAAITDKPTSFSPEAEQNVTLTIMNTRDGDIKNVVITPEGTGIDSYPAKDLVSSIQASSSTAVTFGIIPHQASNLTFHISYQNGANTHTTDVVLPITIGQDKTAAVPVVNNVVLSSSGNTYEITGDITNAGVSDAKGVVVTVGSPAKGAGTYPEYAIGSIASDDSGSFDVTFTCNDLSSVPLVVSWKDTDGNDYSLTKAHDLSTSSGTSSSTSSSTKTSSSSSSSMSGPGGMSGGPGGMGGPGGSSSSSTTSLFTGSNGSGISSFYPVIVGVIILIAGIVLWKKRKWISLKLKKQQ